MELCGIIKWKANQPHLQDCKTRKVWVGSRGAKQMKLYLYNFTKNGGLFYIFFMKKGVYFILFRAKRGSMLYLYNEHWRVVPKISIFMVWKGPFLYYSGKNWKEGSFLYFFWKWGVFSIFASLRKGGLSERAYPYTFLMGVPPGPWLQTYRQMNGQMDGWMPPSILSSCFPKKLWGR